MFEARQSSKKSTNIQLGSSKLHARTGATSIQGNGGKATSRKANIARRNSW